VKERRKDGEKRNEEDEEKEKTHTRLFLFLFFSRSLSLSLSLSLSGAVLGHDACVWSVVNTSHIHTHIHTHTTPILSQRALSRNTPCLYIAPRYPWIGIRARDTRTHNAYKHTATLFPSDSFLSLSILARCTPRSHIGWEWLLMDITTRSSFIITLHRRRKCDIDKITFNGTLISTFSWSLKCLCLFTTNLKNLVS